MTKNITLPINIDFETWANQIRQDLLTQDFPNPPPVEKWREWACQVIDNPLFQSVPYPTELAYPNPEDWKRWADYFVDTVYNIN